MSETLYIVGDYTTTHYTTIHYPYPSPSRPERPMTLPLM